MAGIFTQQNRNVPTGGQVKGPVPQEAIPEVQWTSELNQDVARSLASIPGYENDPHVVALRDFEAQQANTPVVPTPEHQAQTAAFEQDAFGTRATPSFSGAPDAVINPTLEDVNSQEAPVLERDVADTNVVGVDGKPISENLSIDEQIEQQTRKEAQTARQNNMATRISVAEDMDTSFKEQGYPLATRERKVALVTNMMDSLSKVTSMDSRTSLEETGSGRILNRINENIEDSNQMITPAALGMAIDQVLMQKSKILSGKANREALPENGDVLSQALDASGLQAIDDVPGDTSAFSSQEGLVGIKTGTLGSSLLAEVGEVVKQARGAEQSVTFDKNDGLLLELALEDAGLLVEGDYVVRNAKGKATEKNKELAATHKAKFMTRKLFDAVRDNNKGSAEGINQVKLGAVGVTNPQGRAIGEYHKFAPSGKPKPKGTKAQREGSTNNNIFTDYDKVRRKSFRTYDSGVLGMQGLQISALQTYLTTPINQRPNLPPMVQTLAKDMAIHHKVKLDKLDPQAQGKTEKLAFHNAVTKVGNVAKNIADASALLTSNPNGHRLGEAFWSDVTTQRGYPTAFNSNEHNKSMRSALRGHDRVISRSLLKDKKGTDQLITDRDIAALHNYFDTGKTTMDKARMQEIAFVFSYGRQFIPDAATIPDYELVKLITKDNLKAFADLSAPFEALSQLASTPKNLELMQTNPEKIVLDQDSLAAIEQQVSADKIGQALALATEIDAKAPGQVQQSLKSLSDYLNAGDANNVKTHMLNLADMSSASRLQPAVHSGSAKGAQLVSAMGFYITDSAFNPESNQPVVDGVDYTTQNPRWFTVKNALDALESYELDVQDQGESGGTQAAISHFMTEALGSTKAPDYADTIAKIGNMVLEYGRGLQGSTESMRQGFFDFVEDVSNDYNSEPNADPNANPKVILENALAAEGSTVLDVTETLDSIFQTSLLEVANLGYAQATSKVYEAASMLNISAVTVGMDGQIFPVGTRGRKPVYGETVILRNARGETTEAPAYGDVQDLPAEAATAKFIEAEGTYNDPLPYSKVRQASVPARGHITERSIMSDALKRQQDVLGEHQDILMDIHDAEGMAPLEAMAFEWMVHKKSVPHVLKQDYPAKDAKEMFSRIESALRKIQANGGTVMGPDSEYAELTVWFDRKYEALIADTAVVEKPAAFNDPKARDRGKARLKKTAKMLMDAQENGLWSPKVGRTVLGIPFRTKDNANQSSFSVTDKGFIGWYVPNILKDARNTAGRELSHFGASKNNLIEDMAALDPQLTSFMRFGRSRKEGDI